MSDFKIGDKFTMHCPLRPKWWQRLLGIKPKEKLQEFTIVEVFDNEVSVYPAAYDHVYEGNYQQGD